MKTSEFSEAQICSILYEQEIGCAGRSCVQNRFIGPVGIPMRYSICLFVIALLLSTLAQAAEKPNILWVYIEDLSPYMGCYGDPINTGHTPAIDAFAQEGVLFKRAYVPAPVCSAARSAMITGVMQTTIGAHHHRSSRSEKLETVVESRRNYLPEGVTTIPQLMKQAGYFTFNSGKDDYNFYYNRDDLYDVGTKPGTQPGANPPPGNFAEHAGSFTQDTWGARPDKNQPWFGQIMLRGGKGDIKYIRDGEMLADDEVPVPPYYPDTEGVRSYWTRHYNNVRGTDARLEELLKLLKEDGELKNTIVFFFSDHGNNQSLRHKQFCYEGGVHVPLIIQGDHPMLKAGTVRDDLVSGLDISVTTLALGGADMPAYLEGRDLFANDFEPRRHVISARDRCDYTIDRIRTVRTDRFRYIRNFYPGRALLQPQYRDRWPITQDLHRLHAEGGLTEYQDAHWFGPRPVEELYDIAADPFQINNLAADPAFVKELLRHRKILEDWISETDDKGQYLENPAQLEYTYRRFTTGKKAFDGSTFSAEYDPFKK